MYIVQFPVNKTATPDLLEASASTNRSRTPTELRYALKFGFFKCGKLICFGRPYFASARGHPRM